MLPACLIIIHSYSYSHFLMIVYTFYCCMVWVIHFIYPVCFSIDTGQIIVSTRKLEAASIPVGVTVIIIILMLSFILGFVCYKYCRIQRRQRDPNGPEQPGGEHDAPGDQPQEAALNGARGHLDVHADDQPEQEVAQNPNEEGGQLLQGQRQH